VGASLLQELRKRNQGRSKYKDDFNKDSYNNPQNSRKQEEYVCASVNFSSVLPGNVKFFVLFINKT
jgi:hypothetical protein